MTLTELIQATQIQNLPKSKLEEYYDAFLKLFSVTELAIAELEQEEAIYLDSSPEKTDAARVRKWRATEKGRSLIKYKRESKVIEKQLSAVKHKIFSQY